MGRRFKVCFAFIFLLFLSCGQSREKGEGKVEITFWHVMGGPLGRTLDSMIQDFNNTHPRIKVTGVSMGNYDALSQKIMASVSAGNPPTLAQAYENWTAQLIESKAIVPIDDFVRGPQGLSKKELRDFFPVMIEDNSWEGKLWSFPFNKSVPVLYYNKDMFRKEGLNPENPPKDWEEFIKIAKKLTKDLNGDGIPEQWGTAFPVSVWTFGCLLFQNGGSFLNEEGTEAAFNRKEGVEALTYWLNQIVKEKVAYLTTGYEHQNEFLVGKVGMIQSSSASYAYMRPAVKFELGIAPLPQNKRKAVILAGTNTVIFSKASSEAKEAAWEFLKWMTSPMNTARWSEGTSYLPLRQSALFSDLMQKRFAEEPNWRAVIEDLDYAFLEPRSTAWFAVRTYFEEVLERVLREKMSPQEALNMVAEKLNKELRKN